MISNRLSGDDKSLRQYTSTPHLETYQRTGNGHYSSSNGGGGLLRSGIPTGSTFKTSHTTNNLSPYQPTFSTFSHNKSGVDVRYRDDPNPYKVSTIDEFRIKVQDPYKSSTRQIHQMQNNYSPYYTSDERGSPPGELPETAALKRLSLKYDSPQYYQHSTNSGSTGEGGEYEIPDPDYDDQFDGSTAGSSDDLPIPEPLPLPSPPNGDSCEEYSISISASEETASASHSSPSPTAVTKITDEERSKIEHSLRGRKTSIYVADSLANLYYMSKSSTPPRPNSTGSTGSGQSGGSKGSHVNDWVLKYTGVPCLLLDTGETKNRDRRQIQIVLAEACTGLALWKDVVDNLTSYRVTNESTSFHTMHLSSDHTTVVGLSFDDEDSAEKFAHRIDKLTSDFANISLSGSKGKQKKDKIKVKPVKYVRPKKTTISQPCGFMHVSSIKHGVHDLSTLQPFVKTGENKSQNSPPNNSPEFSF